MKIVLATRNQNKIREIKAILGNREFEIFSLMDFPYIGKINEDGQSLEENAVLKAREVANKTGYISVADDSGLEVDALGGRPGVYSARFAGEKVDYASNNKKLLELMKDIPEGKRGACFRCVIAIVYPDGDVDIVEEKIRGEITLTPRGTNGFGYDPIFLDPASGKTFAEMTFDEKNKISHRSRAIFKAKNILKEKNWLMKRSRIL